eukprot:scaffold2273_cov209-Alexandrium_tamarense.AAC.5
MPRFNQQILDDPFPSTTRSTSLGISCSFYGSSSLSSSAATVRHELWCHQSDENDISDDNGNHHGG